MFCAAQHIAQQAARRHSITPSAKNVSVLSEERLQRPAGELSCPCGCAGPMCRAQHAWHEQANLTFPAACMHNPSFAPNAAATTTAGASDRIAAAASTSSPVAGGGGQSRRTFRFSTGTPGHSSSLPITSTVAANLIKSMIAAAEAQLNRNRDLRIMPATLCSCTLHNNIEHGCCLRRIACNELASPPHSYVTRVGHEGFGAGSPLPQRPQPLRTGPVNKQT